ncbi:MAG: N-6 DNA methylase, partial [Pseudomonadota bacterium]
MLSVLGSQGDAGQFRTPRHIIDFMVEVIAPQKGETILDPACGTAGFLISAYKHILRTNTDAKGHSQLTPDERGRLAKNFKGYDISPDMVRLSLVNLYLHGFTDPHIYEYDTLTSEERWNEYADVILANPPFMSPKGGIKPHKRFSIQAKRSEVLFVDYMAEHLTPTGRAGIIVPEGIIFQSQTAYKDLRKLLVENSLVAVVSLPAGVFNPYSGVKTSILILDKSLARQSDTIAFFKVENDGFGLGAQRRAFDKNDLPQVKTELAAYLQALRSRQSTADLHPICGLIVPKEKIAANGDYNLSGERYREGGEKSSQFPWAELGAITLSKPQYGSGASKVNYDGAVRYIRITDLTEKGELKETEMVSPSTIEEDCFLQYGDLLIARSGSVGRTYLHQKASGKFQYAGYLIRFRIDPVKALPGFVFQITQSPYWDDWIVQQSKTGTISNINAQEYASFRLPLPPLEVQKEIVAEIEAYQKVINGARAVLDHYRPHIPIHPEWPMVKLGEVCKIKGGYAFKSSDYVQDGIQLIRMGNVKSMVFDSENSSTYLPREFKNNYHGYLLKKGDLLISMTGTVGKEDYGNVCMIDKDADYFLNQRVGKFEMDASRLDPKFILFYANSDLFKARLFAESSGGVRQANISNSGIESVSIPLPPLATQRAIVAEIEAEHALVAANRELIASFEKKIEAKKEDAADKAKAAEEEKQTHAKHMGMIERLTQIATATGNAELTAKVARMRCRIYEVGI